MASRFAIAALRDEAVKKVAEHSQALGALYGVETFVPPQATRDMEYSQAAYMDALGDWLGNLVKVASAPPVFVADDSKTVAELKIHADGLGLEYDKDIRKADLIALILAAE